MEIMVALAVAAMVLLAARAMFDAIGTTGALVGDAARTRDMRRNGERDLRDLVAQIPAPLAPSDRFEGNSHMASFTTWCSTPYGWQERCRVTIAAVADRRKATLELRIPGQHAARALSGSQAMELRYLANLDPDPTWTATWASTVTLPLAIAVVSSGDTTLLVIGRRG